MSSLIVEVCQIDKVEPHPNADRLDLYTIKGWTVIGSKLEDGSPRYSVGDKVVYVPPETVVPEEVAVRHGVKPYLKPLPKENGVVPPGGRVTVANLRSVKSYGYICLPDDPTWEVGDDVANIYGFTKYETPEPTQSNNHGDAEKPHPSLPKYFDMENLKNYPRVIPEGETVIASIKTHGCFHSMTRITMYDASVKHLKNIKVGDIVAGYRNGQIVPSKVLQVFNHGRNKKQWVEVKGYRKKGNGLPAFTIRCTDNHHFFTDGEWKQIKDFSPGDRVHLYNYGFGMTEVQTQVILGKLLGDGSLAAYKEKISIENTARISFGHILKEYTDWTCKALGFLAHPTRDIRISGYGSTMYRGFTWASKEIYDKFYSMLDTGKKRIPEWVAKELGPIAIAFWYMDDGNLSHHQAQEDRASIATCGFSIDDVQVLIKGLEKFNIFPKLQLDPKGPRIRFNRDEAEKLFILIAPYVPPCYQYKLPERYRGGPGWLPSVDLTYKMALSNATIMSIEKINNSFNELDIATETENYFAHGVLVHNSNYKTGIIREPNSEGQAVWKWAAASNSVRRKKYQEKFNKDGTYFEELNQFWKPLDEPTRNLLAYLSGCGYTPEQIDAEPPVMVSNPGQDVAVYGEIYGSGVQDLTYGYKNGEVAWRAFDILVGGTRYLDYQEKTNLFNRFGVRTVAYVYEGPYSFEKMMELCEGHCLKELAIKHGVEGADKQIQEGLVIFTRREQPCRAGRNSMSRSQFKLISFEYLNRKGGTERH